MPLDRETIHAHMISMVIVEEYISVPSFGISFITPINIALECNNIYYRFLKVV